MRIAYLDCFSGISGDMFLGALLDAGVPPQLFHNAITSLEREMGQSVRLEVRRVMRSGISATKADVIGPDGVDVPVEKFLAMRAPYEQPPSHSHPHGHTHEHAHEYTQEQTQKHSSERPEVEQSNQAARPTLTPYSSAQECVSESHTLHPAEPQADTHAHHRGLAQIRDIICRAAISETAKATAIRIFETLGAAEATIHHQLIERVHFHEVGAVDALVDIVCAAVGAEALGVDAFYCSPLNVGSGTVQCAHGTLPVPAPATAEILRGVPVYSSGPQKELVTPTGAAIVRVLVREFGAMPAMRVAQIGYGAGYRDLPGHPNVLRISIGEADRVSNSHIASLPQDRIAILEVNLDDLSPQIVGYVIEKALAMGALDAFAIPVQMKKSRPGMLLTLLAKPEDAERLAHLLLAETSTLGVRLREEMRCILPRRWEEVQTPWGTVCVKLGELEGKVINAAPEFEDCKKLAEEHGVPLKQVMRVAIAAWEAQRKPRSL